MIEIILKTKDFIIVNKPCGMPSQSDPTGAEDAMSQTARTLAALSEPSELWLVHRLDRVVGGLIVFARNKKSAAALSEIVGGSGMEKEYLAVVEGACEGGILRDFIFKDAARTKAFVVDTKRRGAKEAVLEYFPVAAVETERGIRTLVRVKLHTGRFHQIRVQFSSRGLPLVGDGKYGSRDNKAKAPALFSAKLAFSPLGGANAATLPDVNEYPWSLFNEECYK